jgi:hypothetical protein
VPGLKMYGAPHQFTLRNINAGITSVSLYVLAFSLLLIRTAKYVVMNKGDFPTTLRISSLS